MKKSYLFYLFIAIVVYFFTVYLATASGNLKQLLIFVDIPSLIIILVPLILMLLTHFKPYEIVNAFKLAMNKTEGSEEELKNSLLFFKTTQRLLIPIVLIALSVGIITMLSDVTNYEKIGQGMAVCLLSVLYSTLIFVLVVIPFKSAVQKKLNKIETNTK